MFARSPSPGPSAVTMCEAKDMNRPTSGFHVFLPRFNLKATARATPGFKRESTCVLLFFSAQSRVRLAEAVEVAVFR